MCNVIYIEVLAREKEEYTGVTQRSPVTVLEWPRGFQEVKVPRFHDKGTGWW
jgi:hypothetical protein